MGLRSALQRLFSTFPSGWPGFGLLLQRFGVGIALIYFGISSLATGAAQPLPLTQNLLAVAAALLLLAGLWTPIVGSLAALDQFWIAVTLYPTQRELAWIHTFLAVLAASVAMLGPGAWSIDARLFGRKRFDLDRMRGRKSSP